jgi:integrase
MPTSRRTPWIFKARAEEPGQEAVRSGRPGCGPCGGRPRRVRGPGRQGHKGKRARAVPLIVEIRELVADRLDRAASPDSRLFVGPRGGRISTAVLRDATHWDEVVIALGYEHLRRHDLRHTGLTWMADAGVPVHVLRKIAGHGSLTTTQRYLHPDRQSIDAAGTALSAHLSARRSPTGPPAPCRLIGDTEDAQRREKGR